MTTRLRLVWTLTAAFVMSAPSASWAQQPGEVMNLRWCAGTDSCLEWDAASPPGSYRLVRGTAATLPGLLDATVDSCTVSTFPGTSTGPILTDVPPAGGLFWYLVVATTCAADGSAGAGTAGERVVNSSGDCAPATCSDGLRDGTESDADCGGGSCGGCAPGQHCCAGTDCSTLVCLADACVAATCTDGVRNGSETDVDCGGGCPACPNGGTCSIDSDCQSGFCQGGRCGIASCPDTDGDGCLEVADCCSTNCATIPETIGDGTLANPYSDCRGVTVCAYCTTTSGILATCGNFGGCRVCGMPCLP